MSSFLVASVATFAQPTFFASRPSEKNRSTIGLAKLWIATVFTSYLIKVYTRQRYSSGLFLHYRRPPPLASILRVGAPLMGLAFACGQAEAAHLRVEGLARDAE